RVGGACPRRGAEPGRGTDAAPRVRPGAWPAEARPPVDEVRGALAQEPPSTAAWPNRLREITAAVRGLGDRAKALPADTGAEAVVWAEVAQATIATHGRDLDALAPWIEGLDDLRRALPADGLGTSAVA